MLNLILSTTYYIDCIESWRLQREQQMFSAPKAKRQVHVLKTPQQRSDEEIEAVPAESVHLKRKSVVLFILSSPMNPVFTGHFYILSYSLKKSMYLHLQEA